jgi:dual specificity phosphatase 12
VSYLNFERGCIESEARQELALREHMLDHGQLGPATPAVSRRPSESATHTPLSRSASTTSRRSSGHGPSDSLSMSAIQEDLGEYVIVKEEDTLPTIKSNTPGGRALDEFRNAAQLEASMSMSALEIDEEKLAEATAEDISIEASRIIGRRLSDTVNASLKPDENTESPTAQFIKPTDLVAELYSNPKIMALRTPGLIINQNNRIQKSVSVASAPILANPKCSGYFLEPVRSFFLM